MSNILQDQDNNGTLVMIGVDGELPIQDLDYLDKTSSIEYLVLKNISNPVRHGICHKWHLWKVFFQELTQKITLSVKLAKFKLEFSQSNLSEFVFK